MTELANIQRWLTSIIVKPGTLHDKIKLADDYYKLNNTEVVQPSLRQTSAQRIEIYARGYVARLLECMEAEYPAICHLLGDELFHTFVRAYLVEQPSTSPDLYDLGKNFAAFLKASQPKSTDQSSEFDLPVELAILERSLAEVARIKGLEAMAVKPNNHHDLLYLFNTSNIQASPGLILLKLNWPLADYVKAVYQNQEAEIPEKRESLLAISRMHYRIKFQEIEYWQWCFLQALQTNANYTEAISMAAEQATIAKDTLMADLILWLPVALNFGYIYKNE
ncbi:DNA-binding domain-containing protein [Mucilaginibacter jinjuensis]|uniref:DNA-binding domain-containing protein n=1 Tax=Mucilaginibacter jinjuensis TaxID=1176721 RepID=A0ABY7T3C7_9SPHI|nr:DNA-binding domain-containing protein [Mucilaginibacter jinjuensis]WCT10221.1 DNA-binding domain-containing protein [Mucilaginibacter jinjuensis]